ncbi:MULTISPECIES: NADH-quinone oxidoreductase subunit C [Shewanella]|uniref:NADH dehydrogenase subunit C n=1 Tax=Shewanella fodinae TaxID=552357 RepID=A0A4R2F4A3_9GAMM|nr:MULTISPECIES: NADH-quinone oxidoreductase subunit C [Shewanella]MBO1273373.1 NADH-quinone oxidoreductase subunit C [Shewanella sp. 4t3-1-2LB]TCN76996.1 NADH dehydrogenase subunit C [Shewanella fodinae]
MTDIIQQIDSLLKAQLQGDYCLKHHRNNKGVLALWCTLQQSRDILPVAQMVKALHGRLSTITAYQQKSSQPTDDHEVAYHFDIDGTTLTATIQLRGQVKEIDSLTPIFRNADWHEREFMELYDITVIGHPNPRRLFIDESIDPAVLQRFVPYSAMVNAASTKTLWEHIMDKREEA